MTGSSPRDIEVVWNRFCDDLKQAGKALNRPTTPTDMLTLAEGLRYLARLTRIGLENCIEYADADFPAINQLVDETKKFGCDNPDTIYQTALINGNHAYRLTGSRGNVNYLSFITSKGDDGRSVSTGVIDSSALKVDADGNFEVILSVAPAQGNWLPLEIESNSLSIRQTFLDRRREQPAQLRIERLSQQTKPANLTFEKIMHQLSAASRFTNYCATTFTDWSESYLQHTNALPASDQARLRDAGLDPNIYFYRSCWQLQSDEALVVYIPRLPNCDTWNLQVDNYWQESMDYRYFRSHVNKSTASYNSDGSATMIVAHTDPGHPNWLDTAGHTFGHIGMRYVRAAEHVAPLTRLCKLQDVFTAIKQIEMMPMQPPSSPQTQVLQS